MWKDLVSS